MSLIPYLMILYFMYPCKIFPACRKLISVASMPHLTLTLNIHISMSYNKTGTATTYIIFLELLYLPF